MKLRRFFILAVLLRLATGARAVEATPDDRFFTLMNEALEAQRLAATNLVERRTNTEAFCLLAVKASQTEGLSNIVRFSVAASATEAAYQYIGSISTYPKDLEAFVGPTEISAALFLLCR
jgi:hypothetical protein